MPPDGASFLSFFMKIAFSWQKKNFMDAGGEFVVSLGRKAGGI